MSTDTFKGTMLRTLALAILIRYFRWLPDKLFLQLRYWLEMGYRLNLKNPKTFQEKIQWLKLYDFKPEYTQLVDKLAVKDYVASAIGEKYIIPTLGVWDKFEDIDFSRLPDKFVLKTTHGGGSGGVVVCRDKNDFDFKEAERKLTASLKSDIYKSFRERPYKDVPRRIIAEQLIEIKDKSDLTDYKIFCFDGEPKYIQVIQDRNTCETIDFFDSEWNHQEFYGLNPSIERSSSVIPKQASLAISKPANLFEMLEVARKLSTGHKFLRVDLYNTSGRILFGELTFYPASGLGTFIPGSYNQDIGKLLKLYRL